MKKGMLAAVCAAAGAVSFAESATNEVTDLEPVVVYATRTDDTLRTMPESVSVFTSDAIGDSLARDLPDLLRRKAGVDIHAMNGNPLLTSIAMRGFGDNAFGRVKVVLDGEELNNVDMSAPNLTRIPLSGAERVEIIRGPSPVLYGDGAIAGVVNVSTDARDYARETTVSAQAGSQSTFGGSLRTKGGFEEEGVLYGANYDYLRSDGYRDRSAWEMHTANAGVRKIFDNGAAVGLRANYQNAFYELPGALSHDGWKHARKSAVNHDDWARIWSAGAALDSKMKLADEQWLRLDGGFSHQYRHARYFSSNSDLEYDATCFHVSPRYVNEKDVFGFGSKFTAGFDFRYDRYGEDHPFSFGTPVKRHFDRARYAAFARETFDLTETLSLVAGARLERIGNRWSKYAGLAESRSHDWMGDYELALVFRPVEELRTYVKGTRFHRSAFCDEMSYTADGEFLEPEKGASLDVGAEWRFLDEFIFDVNGYGMIMEDEIFFDPAILPFGYNCNSPAKTRRVGLDTGLSWRRDKVAELSVRYGAVHADFAEGEYHGCDVPFAPNHRVRLEGGFWLFDDLELKGGFSFTGSQYVSGDFANQSEKLPSYSLFDIGAVYTPSWAKGWRASFVMDNLFDRNYCDYAGVGYYYPACGRSFLFTLSYTF